MEMDEDHPEERHPPQDIEGDNPLDAIHAGGVTKKKAMPSST